MVVFENPVTYNYQEAGDSKKTVNFYHTTRSDILEHRNLHSYRDENLTDERFCIYRY
jgi:hypothetical protein